MRWLIALIVATNPAAAADGQWYLCTAWGSSHTGHYTFRIAIGPCAVYWHELDRKLKIIRCKPPLVVAEKPFAVSSGWELHFDLATGSFEDFIPTWSDRGRCVGLKDESKAH